MTSSYQKFGSLFFPGTAFSSLAVVHVCVWYWWLLYETCWTSFMDDLPSHKMMRQSVTMWSGIAVVVMRLSHSIPLMLFFLSHSSSSSFLCSLHSSHPHQYHHLCPFTFFTVNWSYVIFFFWGGWRIVSVNGSVSLVLFMSSQSQLKIKISVTFEKKTVQPQGQKLQYVKRTG